MTEKSGFKLVIGVFSALLAVSLYFLLRIPDKPSDMTVTIQSSVTATEETAKNEKTEVSHADDTSKSERPVTTEKDKTEPVTEEQPLWLDINTASAEDFMRLEGIGEVIAGRITEYRAENGDFLNIEEIMEVDGIGKAIFSDIEPYIYVENPVYPTEPPVTEERVTEPAEDITEEITEAQTESQTAPHDEPETEETVPVTTKTPLKLEDILPLDLNKAEKEELMLLPYVDEEAAEEILKLREDIGGFSSVYELLFVESLKQKEVSEIMEFVIVVKEE